MHGLIVFFGWGCIKIWLGCIKLVDFEEICPILQSKTLNWKRYGSSLNSNKLNSFNRNYFFFIFKGNFLLVPFANYEIIKIKLSQLDGSDSKIYCKISVNQNLKKLSGICIKWLSNIQFNILPGSTPNLTYTRFFT